MLVHVIFGGEFHYFSLLISYVLFSFTLQGPDYVAVVSESFGAIELKTVLRPLGHS